MIAVKYPTKLSVLPHMTTNRLQRNFRARPPNHLECGLLRDAQLARIIWSLRGPHGPSGLGGGCTTVDNGSFFNEKPSELQSHYSVCRSLLLFYDCLRAPSRCSLVCSLVPTSVLILFSFASSCFSLWSAFVMCFVLIVVSAALLLSWRVTKSPQQP